MLRPAYDQHSSFIAYRLTTCGGSSTKPVSKSSNEELGHAPAAAGQAGFEVNVGRTPVAPEGPAEPRPPRVFLLYQREGAIGRARRDGTIAFHCGISGALLVHFCGGSTPDN